MRAVLQLGRNFSSSVVGERMERDMREELYISFLGKSMAFHDMQPVGDTMARATNDVHEVNLMMYPGLNLVVGSANFMIMPLILAPRYHPMLINHCAFIFCRDLLLGSGSLFRYFAPNCGSCSLSFWSDEQPIGRIGIDGVELVKGAGQEEQETAVFHQNAYEFRDAAVEQGKIEARFLPLLLMGITQAIGFALALYMYSLGEISVGDVVAYMGLLALFGFPTFISLTAYSRVSLGLAGARRVLELMKRETLLDENKEGTSRRNSWRCAI